jgi:hypothetical protein
MPRNVDEIIKDIVRAVEVVQTENESYQHMLISHGHSSYVDVTKKKVDIVKQKSREIQTLHDEIKRMQTQKEIFSKDVQEKMRNRDKYIQELESKVPRKESSSLGANPKSSIDEAGKGKTFYQWGKEKISEISGYSHPTSSDNPSDVYKVDTDVGSSAATHEAGADTDSDISEAEIKSTDVSKGRDIIPMNKNDLDAISTIKSNYLYEHLENVLSSLTNEDILFMHNKYKMNSRKKPELLENFKKLAFATFMLESLPADEYRNVQTQYKQLPEYLSGGKHPNRKEIAEGLANIKQADRSTLFKQAIDVKYEDKMVLLQIDAGKFAIDVPTDLAKITEVYKYFVEN